MTVKELITELQKIQDKDQKVLILDNEYLGATSEIKKITMNNPNGTWRKGVYLLHYI